MSTEDVDAQLRRGLVDWPSPETLRLVPPDPAWSSEFAREQVALDAALGGRARAIEHIGATAVPELEAMPSIDVLIVVDDLEDGRAYLPGLQALGHEPWFAGAEVRAFRRAPTDGIGSTVRCVRPGGESGYLALRHRLLSDGQACRRYTEVRRGLAGTWSDARDYLDAKGPLIRALLAEPST